MTEPQPAGGAVSQKPFPEFGLSMDPSKVPWHDAVVWSQHLRELSRLFNPLGTQAHSDDILNELFSSFCIGK